jgi:transposase
MTLQDAINRGLHREPKKAFPESLRDSVTPEDYEALQGLLRNPAWPAQAVADMLQKECDVTVSASTIVTFRRRIRDRGLDR